MKTDVASTRPRRHLTSVSLAVTLLLLLVLVFCAIPCSAADSSVSKVESDPVEKNFDRATKSGGYPWYSSKSKSVVFLPDRPRDTKVEISPALQEKEEDSADQRVWWKVLTLWASVAALTIIVCLLLWYGIREFLKRGARQRFKAEELRRRQRRIETLAEEARVRYDDLDRAAEEALARGDLRSALVFYFSWILVEMDKRDVVFLDKGKTNLEYWRELEDKPQLRELYRSVMIEFERVYFGGRSISRSDFDKVWNQRESFAQMMREEDELKLRLEQEREEARLRAERQKWSGPKSSSLLLLVALSCLFPLAGCKEYWRDQYAFNAEYNSNKGLNGVDTFYRYCKSQASVGVDYVTIFGMQGGALDDYETIVWFYTGDRYGEGSWILTAPTDSKLSVASEFFGWRAANVEVDSSKEGSDGADCADDREKAAQARVDAWRSMLNRYASSNTDDWTKFCLPDSNWKFYSASTVQRYYGVSESNAPEEIAKWLGEKPGRKFIVVLNDQNSEWEYWRAALAQVEKNYQEPEKSKYIEECKSRLADGWAAFFPLKALPGNEYRTPPKKFVANRKNELNARKTRAQTLNRFVSTVGGSVSASELLTEFNKIRKLGYKVTGYRGDAGIEAFSTEIRQAIKDANDAAELLSALRDFLENLKNDQRLRESDFDFSDLEDDFGENEAERLGRLYAILATYLQEEPKSVTDIYSDRVNSIFFDDRDAWLNGVDFGADWAPETFPYQSDFWFRQYYIDVTKVDLYEEKEFDGDPSWTSRLPKSAPFRERVRLEPGEGTETLLSHDGVPIVCRRRVESGEVLLVNSTSFLSNFGLTDETNRKIAARLVEEFNLDQKIAFAMSSNFQYVKKSDQERYVRKKPDGRFSLAHATPFTIFIWHFAILAMIAGFCAWPIFGRPRRVARDKTSDFGMHVDAMARLLKNAGAVDWVREEIDACRKYRRGGEAPETLDEPAPLDDSATPATTKTTRRRLRRRLRILRTNPQDESRDADRGAE
ncbi:MAG: hypothetical protein ACOX0A_05665 [Thermoguttaceae bacterium]|jgi:hypothetical protein